MSPLEVCSLAFVLIGLPIVCGWPILCCVGAPIEPPGAPWVRSMVAHTLGLAWLGFAAYLAGLAGSSVRTFSLVATLVGLCLWACSRLVGPWRSGNGPHRPAGSPPSGERVEAGGSSPTAVPTAVRVSCRDALTMLACAALAIGLVAPWYVERSARAVTRWASIVLAVGCAAGLVTQAGLRLRSYTPAAIRSQDHPSLLALGRSLSYLERFVPPGTAVLADEKTTVALPLFTSWRPVDPGFGLDTFCTLAGTDLPFGRIRRLVTSPGREPEARAALIGSGVSHVLLGAVERSGEDDAERLTRTREFEKVASAGPLVLVRVRGPPETLRYGPLPFPRPSGPNEGSAVELSRWNLSLEDGAGGTGTVLVIELTWRLVGPISGRPGTCLELVDPAYRADPLYRPWYGRLYLYLRGLLAGRRHRFVNAGYWTRSFGTWTGPDHHEIVTVSLSMLHEGMGPGVYEIRVGHLPPGSPLRRWLRIDDGPSPATTPIGSIRRVEDRSPQRFHFELRRR